MTEEALDVRTIDFSQLSNEDALEALDSYKEIALKDLYLGLLIWGIPNVEEINNLDMLYDFLFNPESLAAVEYCNFFAELGKEREKAYYNMRDSYDKLNFIESTIRDLS